MNKIFLLTVLLSVIIIDNLVSGKDRLDGGEVLFPGNYLQSNNGRYKAVMQEDGNFAHYVKKRKFKFKIIFLFVI